MTFKWRITFLIMLCTIISMLGTIIVAPTCTDCDKDPYVVFDTTIVILTDTLVEVDTVEVEKIVEKLVTQVQFDTITVTDTLRVQKIIVDTVESASPAHAYVMTQKSLDKHFKGLNTVYSSFWADSIEGVVGGLVGTYEEDLCCITWYPFTAKLDYLGPWPSSPGSWSIEQIFETE